MVHKLPKTAFRLESSIAFVNVSTLYSALVSSNGRKQEWFIRTVEKIKKAPSNVRQLCSEDFFKPRKVWLDPWVTAIEALALLTYCTRSALNTVLIQQIEEYCGVHLPTEAMKSKFEPQFGLRLEQLIESLSAAGTSRYVIEWQKKVDAYRVDFLVTEYKDGCIGSNNVAIHVIEFDEEFHRKDKFINLDTKRDAWFKKFRKDWQVIRVRHEEQDAWIDVVEAAGKLVTLEECYFQCVLSACTVPQSSKLVITSDSSKRAYLSENNPYSFLLSRKTQRLNEFEKLLTTLNVEHVRKRSIHIVRSSLLAARRATTSRKGVLGRYTKNVDESA